MIDILFTSVPYTETTEPIMAPGVLKAMAVKNGFTSNAIDLNIELLPFIHNSNNAKNIIDFFVHNNLHSNSYQEIIQLIDRAVERILSFNPKMVGLSLLTVHGQVFTHWLCVRLKSVSPDTQIIVGGGGIKATAVSNKNDFCTDLLSRGLIDHYITGDGELSLVELLKGNYEYPGIDSPHWQELTSMDNFPYPDYNDYDFSLYEDQGIPINDSRGCVRTCEFCDVIEYQKKFVYRSAESIFAEMQSQIDRYKIYHFSMKNSLTNGNFKEFKKLMLSIAEYNSGKDRSVQMSWSGYFIIRPQEQHPEELWEVMSKTNPFLFLGVESVIHHVRWGLGKKFANEDIDFHLEMAQKYNVPLGLLLMIGYPTETRDDYEFTKQWFKDRVHYAHNPVVFVNLSHTSILENTKLEKDLEKLNVVKGAYRMIWMSQTTMITPQERAKYAEELYIITQPFNPPTGIKQRGLEMLSQMTMGEYA